jgi:hypothetical protein
VLVWAILLAAAVASLAGPASTLATPAHRAATPADRAATHAYLEAQYTFSLAIADNGPRAVAAVDALVAKLTGECPGVLAGAPVDETVLGDSHPLGTPPPTPRARGEAQRRSHQLITLEGELGTAVFGTAYQPDHQAIATYVATVTHLNWSDPRIAKLVSFRATLVSVEPNIPNVCADMRSWVAGGYRTVSSGTKEYEAQQEARVPQAYPRGSIDSLLKRFEGPAERALIRRDRAIARRELAALVSPLLAATDKLRAKLGLKGSLFAVHTHGTIVGHGSTRAGERFVVRVRKEDAHGSPCRHEVSVEYRSQSHSSSRIFANESGSSDCLSGRTAAPQPSVECDEGLLRIKSRTLARTRSVHLLLSDGTSLNSPAIAIPARLGGPVGVYIQALRGPSPFPVSLTELDAHGRTLRTLKLQPVHHCKKTPSPEPTFRAIVRATTPDGTPFTITGMSVNFTGHAEFSLSIHAGHETGGVEESASSESAEAGIGARRAILTEVSLLAGCSSPHQYGIVYAHLKTPGATVLAQTASGLVPLQLAGIPAALHAKGVLVYGAFPTFPSELIVRAADGTTLMRESLAERAKEEVEFCEGRAEP